MQRIFQWTTGNWRGNRCTDEKREGKKKKIKRGRNEEMKKRREAKTVYNITNVSRICILHLGT
jgi:hypothetical protein